MASDIYGLHRVVGERGILPQGAERLNTSLPIRENELLIDVERLNIDAASFQQLKNEAGGDSKRLVERICSIVRSRGKMHNPLTDSGGMLIGRVREVGPQHPAKTILGAGDQIATLVSLTLTPLVIEEVIAIHPHIDRLDVRGYAILFATGLYAKLPADLPEEVALAALDVCGAPALIERYVKPGMKVAVLGTGKSGVLCLAQARRSLGGKGRVMAIDVSESALATVKSLSLCDDALRVDATRPVEVMEKVLKSTEGRLCDLAINCASVPNTEAATILSVRNGASAIFFSMATKFAAAALVAEGAGKDVTMLIGNGYTPGHAELALNLVRTVPGLRAFFEERYLTSPR